MYVIDDELKELIESGVAAAAATADEQGRPHLAVVWGPRVHPDRSTITVFLETARGMFALDDLRSTKRIAMTIADPVSYRSVQFKGSQIHIGDATEEDRAWVQRHREAFMVAAALVGESPVAVRNRWMDDVFRVDFKVEQAFDQTPGPRAGQPL
jgi:hypothetical protein